MKIFHIFFLYLKQWWNIFLNQEIIIVSYQFKLGQVKVISSGRIWHQIYKYSFFSNEIFHTKVADFT